MKKYSAFAVAREALRDHLGWERAWRSPEPQKKYDVIIIGAGGHAKSCIDILESTKKFKLVGIVEKKKIKSKKILSYKIIGNDNDLCELKEITKNIFIGVGLINNYRERFELINRLNELKFNFIKIISSKAYVSLNS